MNSKTLIFILGYFSCVHGVNITLSEGTNVTLKEVKELKEPEPFKYRNLDEKLEDEKVVNETIVHYGNPQNFRQFNLPGPELMSDENLFLLNNTFESQQPGTYKMRTRTITDNFSYNGRYEEGIINKTNTTEIPIVKGQFGEHFLRKSGGHYIRTIGYIQDENGYRQFLIDLTTAKLVTYEKTFPFFRKDSVYKVNITSTVLATLIGGNLLR